MNMHVIEEFLKNKEKNTQRNYRWIINQYFNDIQQNPETYFKQKKYDYKKDIDQWWEQHLNEVPKTRNTKLNIIKSFFEYQEVLYPKKYWIGLRRMKKGSRAATLDRTPTIPEFKKMLSHGTLKDKALFLLAASSGMRIQECLSITEDMIDFDHDPCMIRLPGSITKTGDPRIVFCSDEAREYIQEWRKERDTYLDQAIRRTKHIHKKDRNDDTVFPFKYNIAWTRWIYLLKKARLDKRDPTTNRYTMHIHVLRKFFMSQMKTKAPEKLVETLVGHESYLDDSYRRYTIQELSDAYKSGVHLVCIFNQQPDLSEVNDEIVKLKNENAAINQRMIQMENEFRQKESMLEMISIRLEVEKLKNGQKK